MENTVIEYVIADDHELFRQGLSSLLDKDGQFKCIGQAKDGAELLLLLKELEPQAIVLDFRMPGMDGLEALRELRRKNTELPVLMLTVDKHPYLMYQMFKQGTNGILLKGEATVEETKYALRDLVNKGCYFNEYFNPRVVAKALASERKSTRASTALRPLSEREVTVLRYICNGNTSLEIAAMIHASPRTVDRVRILLFEKTQTKHLGELVVFAIQSGIFDPERHTSKPSA